MEQAVEEAVNMHEGPYAITQKPLMFFNIPRLYERFLRRPTPMPRIVGADVRRIQDHGGFDRKPWHMKHLENISVRV